MPDLPQRLTAALADRYRIERELGRRGMATVFIATDLKHHRQVALKVLDPEVAQAVGPERFLREIETVARPSHPHVLPLHDSGQADGLPFYVMPYVEGGSLRQRLERERQLPVDDALRIAREVADALGCAHAHGLVHRDIKPENVLLESGHAVVADFGIARAVAALQRALARTPADRFESAARFAEGLAVTSEGAATSAPTVAKEPTPTPKPNRLYWLAGAAVIVALLAAGAWLAQRGCAPRAPAHARTEIAVLPFQNLSVEGPHAGFAGGLHEELLTQLAKVAALKFISRTSVMGYAAGTKPLKQVASELGVGSIVEGSVQVAGNRLRVNVQLIDAATDEHLWAESYDRTLDDAFAIQSEVAKQVVAAVGVALAAAERLALMDDLTGLARTMAREGLRRRHPEASETELQAMFAELVLGRELAARVLEHRRRKGSMP